MATCFFAARVASVVQLLFASLAVEGEQFVKQGDDAGRVLILGIGRKNWLHLGSKETGPKIAAIFSVIESCRRLCIRFAPLCAADPSNVVGTPGFQDAS